MDKLYFKQVFVNFLVKENPLEHQNLQKCTDIAFCLHMTLFGDDLPYTVTLTKRPLL